MAASKRKKKWSVRVQKPVPVDGMEGVFLIPPRYGQLKELDALTTQTMNLADDDPEAAAPTQIIRFLWDNLVVDEDGDTFEYEPDEMTVVDLACVRRTITKLSMGEAPGSPGDEQ